MPRNVLIQIRKGTSAQWTAANPILAVGEPGFETDTGVLKIGDGTSTWGSLSSVSGGSVDLKPYCVTATSGGTITGSGGSALTATLSTEQVTNANYSLSSNQITVTDAGTYQISYAVETVDVDATGGPRDQFQAWIEADSVEITQSRAGDYHREQSGGGGISNSFICSLSALDVLELKLQGTTATPPNSTQGLTQISILKVG